MPSEMEMAPEPINRPEELVESAENSKLKKIDISKIADAVYKYIESKLNRSEVSPLKLSTILNENNIDAETVENLQRDSFGAQLRLMSFLQDIDKLATQLSLFRSAGLDRFPVWRFQDDGASICPVDLGNAQNFAWTADFDVETVFPLTPEFLSRLWTFYETKYRGDDGPGSSQLQEASRTFADTIGSSIRSLASNTPLNVSLFTVFSQNPGYRVYSTERYWMSPMVFGSGLTIPVKGHLPDDDYRFGGCKPPGNTPIWDAGIHRVSSTNRSTMLIAI